MVGALSRLFIMTNRHAPNTTAVNGSVAPPGPPTVRLVRGITQRIYTTVQFSKGITQRIYTTVQFSKGITQDIYWPTVQLRRWITQRLYTTVQLSMGITQNITIPTAQLSKGITQRLYTTVQLSKGITQQIYDSQLSSRWRSRVLLNGVDYSARLIGSISVTHEKNASSLAEFQIIPSPGPFDPLAWVRQAVHIDDVLVDADGVDIRSRRIFTGQIEVPKHDADASVVSFICSTVLQAKQNALPREQIAAQIPGSYWSEHVFSDDASGWRYTQDRLNTVQLAMWVDRLGQTRVTSTEAAVTPDITITDAKRLYKSAFVQRAEKSTIINHVHIDLDFRFDRFKQRNHVVSWQLGMTICEFLKSDINLPTRDMISSAAEGSSWELQGGVGFKNAWPPGVVDCGRSDSGARDFRVWGWKGVADGTHYTDGLTPAGGYDYEGIANLCIGASFTLGYRWAQTVTETYALDVKSQSSIDANGERAITEGYGIETESDAEAFEADKTYLAAITASGNTSPASVAGGAMSTMPAGTIHLDNGDYLFEATSSERSGRTAMVNAVETALNKADTTIKNSHRENYIGCTILMQQGMEWNVDLDTSMRIESATATGEGRVVQIVYERDIASGSALDKLQAAVLQVGATGLDEATPLDPPEAPDSEPLTDPIATLPISGSSQTHIGGSVTSPPYNPDWTGYVTNYLFDSDDTTPLSTDENDPEANYYTEGFYVATPEIGDVDRQAIEAQAEQEYLVELNENILSEVA